MHVVATDDAAAVLQDAARSLRDERFTANVVAVEATALARSRAATTQACLDAGAEHVALHTERTNPTSNAIDQAIGCLAGNDACEWDFN